MRYELPLDKHKGAKVVCANKYDPITELRTILSIEQLDSFSKSCFGHLMNLPNFKLQNQLIHNLLVRQLVQPNIDEIWIGVAGVKLKFGITEFATITGLRCVGNYDKKSCSKVDNSFVKSYFDDVSPIFRSSVKDALFAKRWKNDGDAVKMALLYFLHHFLLTSTTNTQICKGDLDILDSDKFDKFPWGKEVFITTLESLKNSPNTSSKDNYYRLCGFPYALQIWFYECCPYLNGKYCTNSDVGIPRCLNWTTDYMGKFEEFSTMLSLGLDEVIYFI